MLYADPVIAIQAQMHEISILGGSGQSSLGQRDKPVRPGSAKTFLQATDPSSVKARSGWLKGPGCPDIFTSKLKSIQTTSHGAQANGNKAIVTSQSTQNRQILSFRRPILAPQRPIVQTLLGGSQRSMNSSCFDTHTSMILI